MNPTVLTAMLAVTAAACSIYCFTKGRKYQPTLDLMFEEILNRIRARGWHGELTDGDLQTIENYKNIDTRQFIAGFLGIVLAIVAIGAAIHTLDLYIAENKAYEIEVPSDKKEEVKNVLRA